MIQEATRRRLIGALKSLASDDLEELIDGAQTATSVLAAAGVTWHQVITGAGIGSAAPVDFRSPPRETRARWPGEKPIPRARWKSDIEFVLENLRQLDWHRSEFVRSIQDRVRLWPEQLADLRDCVTLIRKRHARHASPGKAAQPAGRKRR